MATSNQCVTCNHYRGGLACDAFPEGIPDPVLTGLVDHRKPTPGDNGITWEPIPTVDPDHVFGEE